MISCRFICVFAVLINKVSLQVTVKGFIDGSVVLPCSSAQHDLKPQDIDVSWRHNSSKIVFDIIPHSNVPMTQDPEYKNRIETFPQEYLRGNFSIKLNHLQHTDAGKYICYIKNSDKYQTLKLIINGSISIEQGNQGGTEREGMGPTLPLLLVCIISPVLLVIIFIAVFFRKRCSSSQRATGNVMSLATTELSMNHADNHI